MLLEYGANLHLAKSEWDVFCITQSYLVIFSYYKATTTMAFTANTRPRAAISKVRVTRLSKVRERANRAANKANKVLSPPRDMHLIILQIIVEVLRERRQTALETTGNTGRGLLKSIISEHIKHFPWLTRHMVNHYIATHPYGQRICTVVVTNSKNETVVSGLTDPSPVAQTAPATDAHTD
jgi:hypothetical protein